MPRDGVTEWHDTDVIAAARVEMTKRMGRATRIVDKKAKELASRAQPTATVGRQLRDAGGRFTSGRRRVGLDPSVSPEPPKIITGTLRANIAPHVLQTPRAVLGFVGVRKGPASKYAMRIELGFVGRDSRGRLIRQGPRSFLRRALLERIVKVARTLGAIRGRRRRR